MTTAAHTVADYVAAMRVRGLRADNTTGGAAFITATRAVTITTGAAGDWANGVAYDTNTGRCTPVVVAIPDQDNPETVADAWAAHITAMREADR